MRKDFRFSTVISAAAAFCAYFIGAGFATGQEALQYFAAYGGVWTMIIPLVVFGCTAFVWSKIGFNSWAIPEIKAPADAFNYYCGFKGAARVADILVLIITGLFCLSMFAGCGAALEQYLGIPQWVGAVGLGVVAYTVIWFGLESITNVLSFIGLVIIGFVALVGIYSFITQGPGAMLEGSQKISDYVDSGDVLIANVMGIKNPILSGVWYFGTFIVSGYTFIVAQGQRMKSYKEGNATALVAGLLFIVGLYMMIGAVLANIDYIVSVKAQVPILAVIDNIMPILAPVFALVVVSGIFTTIVGYSWTIGRRFASDKTTKQRLIVLAIMIVGVGFGSTTPFAVLINFISPLSGCIGVLLSVYMVVGAFIKARQRKGMTKSEAPEALNADR